MVIFEYKRDQGVKSLSSIDIRAAFLQSENLEREVYVHFFLSLYRVETVCYLYGQPHRGDLTGIPATRGIAF